jgi:hypothetical protein
VWELVQKCFSSAPAERPTFVEVVAELGNPVVLAAAAAAAAAAAGAAGTIALML